MKAQDFPEEADEKYELKTVVDLRMNHKNKSVNFNKMIIVNNQFLKRLQ